VLRESGRVGDAVQLARLLLDARPDSNDDAFELGLSLLADNKPSESLPYLKRAAEKLPANKFAHLNYGIALEENDRINEAVAEYHAVRDLDSAYVAQLALAARRIANDPDAKPSQLRTAARYASAACRMSDSPSVVYLDTYAIALARLGKYREAVNESTKAADLARVKGDTYLASRIEARTASFRVGKPYLPETIANQP
jgi:tetratricopeptide (TPR) repeat protein